jgi:hypothetical protein
MLEASTTGKFVVKSSSFQFLIKIFTDRRNAYLLKKAAAQASADPYRYYYEQQLQNQN